MTRTDTGHLNYTIEGRTDGPTLLFIHGWPDNAELWRLQVAKLKAGFRCVLVTLPNFGDTADMPAGCDFPALIAMLDRTIDEILPDQDQQLVLVTHDWGAYLGYLYEKSSPQRIRAMIAMDIGGHFQQTSIRATLMILGYQWALAGSWVAGRLIPRAGDWLTRQVARVLRVPVRQLATVRARYNYLYFYFWRAMLLPSLRPNLLAHYRPKCPVLFLYGDRKPIMFHSERWLAMVDDSGGQSVCVKDAGHWFMETHADKVNEAILEWPPLADAATPPPHRHSGPGADM